MSRAKALTLVLGLALSACMGKAENSSQAVNTPPPNSPAGRFAVVREVLQNKCSLCHPTWAGWTEQDFLIAPNNFVIAGNPSGSYLYQRLKGSGSSNATMPQSGEWNLSDLAKFQEWITRIGEEPEPTPSPSASPTGPNANQRRDAALIALQVNGCLGCHTNTRTATSAPYSGATVPAYGGFTTDMQFVTSGLIIPANSQSSWLYRALRGYGDIALMPAPNGTVPAADAKAIKDWIDNLANP